ncbi:hypothetical protein GMES_3313 [Paraglaciecola mesophila KMM 241]|uniref:Uncharacterized protein n=1 Tax=Paraglaciecola mesophila KMM 241 TaxID=1128912 RepID=K6YNL9_9ALTE|nr:hypothetical protein GMES_3313 [Paraglaciecola mesophila KMM 241]
MESGKTVIILLTDFRNITILKVFVNVCFMLLPALFLFFPPLV